MTINRNSISLGKEWGYDDKWRERDYITNSNNIANRWLVRGWKVKVKVQYWTIDCWFRYFLWVYQIILFIAKNLIRLSFPFFLFFSLFNFFLSCCPWNIVYSDSSILVKSLSEHYNILKTSECTLICDVFNMIGILDHLLWPIQDLW